jgi:hypothetical protein
MATNDLSDHRKAETTEGFHPIAASFASGAARFAPEASPFVEEAAPFAFGTTRPKSSSI